MYFLMGKGAHAATDRAEAAAEPMPAPIFVPITPFTINLRSAGARSACSTSACPCR
ncbi:hypothetical protein ACFSHR_01850 [Azotobacter chroococcum]